MNKSAKTEKTYTYYGFGFPVVIIGCPMTKVLDEWVPRLSFRLLADSMAIALPLKKTKLTGNEVRFLRVHFNMTLQEMADKIGLTRQAIAKWEKAGDRAAAMLDPIERDFRVLCMEEQGVKPKDIIDARQSLLRLPKPKSPQHRISHSAIRNRRKLFSERLHALSA